jgi:ABC-type phosphate transport system substrate-binding protein
MRKRSFVLVAGSCLAALSLAVGSAMADPSSIPRNLNGTGSDTTQGVMNELAKIVSIGGVLQIGSWDAATAPGQTFDTGKAGCSAVSRPSGSNNGIIALVNDRNAGTHCLQFARSSSDNHTAHSGDHLTYIPFATDAVAYAIRGPGASPQGSSINRNLAVATLKTIYTQTGTSCLAAFEPLLPQFGSGTRKFFLENVLGLGSGADVSNYAGPGGLHPCVKDTDSTGNPLLENTGNLLTTDKQIEPYSVSSWIAQTAKNVSDVHGVALLGNIEGVPSMTINGTATGVRPVFNVVPNVLVQGPSNSKTAFVGSNSLVCQNSATILKQGFLTRSDCGDTTIQSDPNLGTDTVGAGE